SYVCSSDLQFAVYIIVSSGRFVPSILAITLLDVARRKVLVIFTPVVTFIGTALKPGFLASSINCGSNPPISNKRWAISLDTQPSNSGIGASASSVSRYNCGPLQPLRTTSQP